MRKIHITESQWEAIMESEGYPLDLKADNGKPDNFTEYEVAVDNTDKDAPNDLTIADTITTKRSKEGWFGMNRYPAMHRLPEGKELDNTQVSGFGVKNDALINSAAEENGGKMISNLSSEINSNKRGVRKNTIDVRLSRLRDQKENNPELYQKNGAEATEKALQDMSTKISTAHNEKNASNTRKTNMALGIGQNSSNGAYYFK